MFWYFISIKRGFVSNWFCSFVDILYLCTDKIEVFIGIKNIGLKQ